MYEICCVYLAFLNVQTGESGLFWFSMHLSNRIVIGKIL